MSTDAPVDPVELSAALIRCPSVTPEEGGAIRLLEDRLSAAGFACRRADRGEVSNLYARFGADGPVFGFNGHTDVVPVGDADAWSFDPFGGEVRDGEILGRGATDMKTGVAAFAAAAMDVSAELSEAGKPGSIALLITGDEEGPSVDGTVAILDWMEAEGERLDLCLVGEPTSREVMGDMIKIGRRGSLTAHLTAVGRQGHTAYPDRALNPLPALCGLLAELAARELDAGTEHFQPSTLALTTVDVGNAASNVIPREARATLNIRFNDTHTGASLTSWLEQAAAAAEAESGVAISVEVRVSGEAFLTPPGALSELLRRAVEAETGVAPELSTSGGTSDARFVKNHCPVAEFGLVGRTMHQVDERAYVEEVETLKAVYARALRDFFGLAQAAA
ncbi:MAG: succinyl-diaminopimelate desuccinylase [Pseudomonadota bacterium]